MSNRFNFRIGLGLFVLSCGALPEMAQAKERYLEQVRTTLMLRASRCVTCHIKLDPALWEDEGLNYYGQRLKSVEGGSSSLADRMLLLDRLPNDDDDQNKTVSRPPVGEDGEQLGPDLDVDADGVPNWVEILAESNPGDKKDRPSDKRIERVQQVVSCKICHTANHVPGAIGRAANPHNELGELLALTDDPDDIKKRVTADERRSAAERVPILKRIAINKRKRPDGDRATYWERLRLMYLPIDKEKETSKKRLMSLRKQIIAQKSKRRRDPSLGVPKEGHELGFVEDAKGLD